jgi:cytochrome P450
MYKMFSPIVGSESILSADKKDWLSKRRAFISGFSPTFLRHMVDVMIEKLGRMEKCIDFDIQANQATNMLQRS